MLLGSSEWADNEHERDNESCDHGSGDNQTDMTLTDRPTRRTYRTIAVFAIHAWQSIFSMRTGAELGAMS